MKLTLVSDDDTKKTLERFSAQINNVDFATKRDIPEVEPFVQTLTALHPPFFKDVEPGTLVLPSGGIGGGASLSTIAMVIHQLEICPFLPGTSFYTNQVGAYCTAITATPSARIVVYSSNEDNTPASRLYQSASLLLPAGGAISDSCELFFEAKKLYWVGLHLSGTATMRGVPLSSCFNLGLSSATATAMFTKLRQTLFYGPGAPQVWTYSTSQRQTGVPPVPFFTIAAAP